MPQIGVWHLHGAEILAKEVFPSIQSGRWEPREEKGTYNYIDIKPLGLSGKYSMVRQ